MLDLPFRHEDVQEFETIVLINGQPHKHLSWSKAKDSTLGLPSPIVESSDSSITRATITFPPVGDEVTYRLLNPWQQDNDSWPPTPGQSAVIEVRYELDGVSYFARRFTGYIDSISGGVEEPLVLNCADEAHLTSTLTLKPQAVTMPGVGIDRPWNETDYYVSPSDILPFYAAQAALTRSGFGFYPRKSMEDINEEDVLIRWDLQGSVMPTIGDFLRNEEGLEWVEEDGILRPNKWVWGMFPKPHSAVTMRMVHRVGAQCRVADDKQNGVWLQVFGPNLYVRESYDGTLLDEFPLPYIPAKWGWITVTVTPQADPQTAGSHFRLEMWSGSEKQVDQIITHSRPHAAYVQGGAKETPACQVSVANPAIDAGEGWDKADYRINYTPSNVVTGMDATRTHSFVQTADLIKEVSRATCTAIYMDDFGVWQYKPLDVLLTNDTVAEMDVANHVYGLSWKYELDSRRSMVKVNYHRTSITVADGPELKLWAPSSAEEIKPNTSVLMVMEPPEYSEWLSPDVQFRQVAWVGHGNDNTPGQVDNIDRFNTGKGSYWGIVGSYNEGENLAWLYFFQPTCDVEMQNPRKILARHHLQSRRIPADGVYPAPDGQPAPDRADGKYFLATSTVKQIEINNLGKIWQNYRLPILRGPGYVRFYVESVTSTTENFDGSQYTHRLSEWGREEDARRLLAILNPLMSNGLPTISEIPVRYNPLLGLGDKITIEAERLLGVKLTCLIRSIDEGQSNDGEHYLELGLVVVDADRTGLTYTVEDAAHGVDATYRDDQTLRAGNDYQTITATPIDTAT